MRLKKNAERKHCYDSACTLVQRDCFAHGGKEKDRRENMCVRIRGLKKCIIIPEAVEIINVFSVSLYYAQKIASFFQ